MISTDFMIFEDERSQMETIKRSLLRKFPNSEVHTESNPYTVFQAISMLRPDVLIVDYQFRSIKITDEEKIMCQLFKSNGLVIIYSSSPPDEIRRDIMKRFDFIPANFKIISKRQPSKLIQAIEVYNESH